MSFQHMDHAEYSKHSKFQNSAVGRALDSGVVDRAVSGLIQTLEREGGNQSRTVRKKKVLAKIVLFFRHPLCRARC